MHFYVFSTVCCIFFLGERLTRLEWVSKDESITLSGSIVGGHVEDFEVMLWVDDEWEPVKLLNIGTENYFKDKFFDWAVVQPSKDKYEKAYKDASGD